MKTTQLKHEYTVMECYPSLLFESMSIYNEYLKTHTKEETDIYIKDWIHNRVIECIEQDLKYGIIHELPEGWKDDYIKYLNRDK
jgi:predicted nucleic acid binding AN1-type Zn finger protein